MREMTKSLSKISLKSSFKQTDHEKSISLDQNLILWWRCFAWSNFRIFMVRNSLQLNSNFLLGQKFVAVEFKFEFCEGRPPLAMPNGTNIPVSHIILYELSDFILYRQTNGTFYDLITTSVNYLQKCKDWSQEGQFCEGRPPLAMPNGTNTPVSHIILNGSMYKWNPASGILNELSDCILYRQTNGTLWINFSMFLEN